MSTNSTVGRKSDDKGRYVHWDGYPSGVGVALVTLLKRDGYEKVMSTIVDEHYGWSSIDCEGAELEEPYNDGRFVAVPGYGMAYTTEQGQSSPDEYLRAGEEEYGYLVDERFVTVCESTGYAGYTDSPRMLGKVDWHAENASERIARLDEE